MEYANGKYNDLIWKNNENRYHHEEKGLTLDNLNVNISMLGSLICDDSCVLDVGCGEGKLAKLIEQKNCKLYGIELDSAAIKYAISQNRYEDIFQLNIEDLAANEEEFRRFEENRFEFDYIVLSDILEHTVNPTKALCDAAKYLKYFGKILISIPNVNNADIILNLLRGRFNYMQSGILDNTHTKYFTKTSFIEWISEINKISTNCVFECKYIGGTFGLTDYMQHIKDKLPMVSQYIQLNPEHNVIQNLFVLTKLQKQEATPELDDLIKLERVDLVQALEDILEEKVESYCDLLGAEKLIPNERTILEEKLDSAQNGWKRADIKIQELVSDIESNKEGWKKAESRIEELELDLKINKEGWKKAENRAEALEADLKINRDGWQKAENKIEELEEALSVASDGWSKSDARVQELETALNDSNAGWKIADEKVRELESDLQINKDGWQKAEACIEELRQALKAVTDG